MPSFLARSGDGRTPRRDTLCHRGRLADEELVAKVEKAVRLPRESQVPSERRRPGYSWVSRRREIHGNATESMRQEKSAIFERRADAVAGFFNSSVGSPTSEMMHAGIEGVHFDFNEFAFESGVWRRKNLGRHMAHG